MSRHIVTALPLLSIDLNQGGNAPGGGGGSAMVLMPTAMQLKMKPDKAHTAKAKREMPGSQGAWRFRNATLWC